MRVHTITSTKPRSGYGSALAIVLGACALTMPVSAGAMQVDAGTRSDNATAATPSASNDSGSVPQVSVGYPTPTSGSNSSGALGADPDGIPTQVSVGYPTPATPTGAGGIEASSADEFDWGSAAVGAGAALALVAFGAAALLTVRKRTGMSPSVSAS